MQSPMLALWLIGTQIPDFAPAPSFVNTRVVAGIGACVIIAFLLLIYSSRRRRYVRFWVTGWGLTAISMFLAAGRYSPITLEYFVYGLSQFCAVAASTAFVMSADAYDSSPRLPRWYVLALMLMLIWFALAPVALGPQAVYASGHLLNAGTLCAAGFGYLALAQRTRMVGAALAGSMLVLVAASNVWIALWVPNPDDVRAGRALFISLGLYLMAALGMQLFAFEDMTQELRVANERLEAAQADLKQLVVTDPLTGCRNRRFFEQVIGRELTRHRREQVPLSMLFIDIDHFKRINDTLGHEAGDRVLREVAAFGTAQRARGRLRVSMGRRRIPGADVLPGRSGTPAGCCASGGVQGLRRSRGATRRRRSEHRLRRGAARHRGRARNTSRSPTTGCTRTSARAASNGGDGGTGQDQHGHGARGHGGSNLMSARRRGAGVGAGRRAGWRGRVNPRVTHAALVACRRV